MGGDGDDGWVILEGNTRKQRHYSGVIEQIQPLYGSLHQTGSTPASVWSSGRNGGMDKALDGTAGWTKH